MQRVLVLNGPNLNLLGTRLPEVYGTTTLAELDQQCRAWGTEVGFGVECHQSNHEGDLIDRIHAARRTCAGMVVNPGALSHYSYAIHDAIEAVELPAVEVHISNVKAREDWRRHSVVTPACIGSIYGRGIGGYRWALAQLAAHIAWRPTTLKYGPEPDHIGDLRVPAGDGPHPVIVLVHGGFWREPWHRDLMDRMAVDLARRGFATWNVEYRRVGAGGGWPVTLLDAGSAVDHVAALAADHPLDRDRVAAVGHSAGGQLAMWAAARTGLDSDAPGASPEVQLRGVLGLAPVADLAAAQRAGLGDGAVDDLLRRAPDDDPGRYRHASPAARLPLGIRQVVVHGTDDDRVPIDHARDYVTAAVRAGDPASLVELPGIGHFDLINPRSKAWEAVITATAQLFASD